MKTWMWILIAIGIIAVVHLIDRYFVFDIPVTKIGMGNSGTGAPITA